MSSLTLRTKMNKNDLFYLCSLLESVSRKTGQLKKDIVNKIGEKELNHLYVVASVNHCLPIAQVTEEIIEKYDIKIKENSHKKSKTTVWDNGKIYQRLIIDISSDNNWLENLIKVYNSWICRYLDDESLPIYWQPRSYIKECYLQNKII